MSASAGFVSVPVIPTFKGMTKEFAERLEKPAKQAGERAGKAMSAPLDGAVQGLERQVKASTGKLDQLDRAHEKSVSKRAQQQDKLEASTLRLEDAENKYKAAVAKGDNGLKELARVKDEKAKVKKATDDLRQAEVDVTVAERKRKDQLDDLTRTTEKYEDAQAELNNSVKGSGGIFAIFREDVRKVGAELDDTAEKSAGFGDKLMSGLGKVGTGALLGVGAKIGTSVMGGIDTAFDKGFSRLASIEQAETMLGGLGHSAEGVTEIMDNAMESVSGTAYGFGEAASMAATFAGAGIEQGEELTEILSLVGDSAAITGADFEEMGSIWTKMASSGRLSTDEMNQMMDRGLGLLPELQKHYNISADEARKMVSDGKVSFEDFSEVMENMVGGSAQAMGETFSGSAANMQAALGRLGAKFLDPIYENAPAIFQAIGGSVDKLGEHLGPLVEDFSEKLNPYIQEFAEKLGPWLERSIDDLAGKIEDLVGWGREAISWMQDNQTWLGPLAAAIGGAALAWGAWTLAVKGWQAATKIATAVQVAFNAVMSANPIMLVVIAVAALVAGLTYFFTQTELGQELWKKFTDFLSSSWKSVSETFSSVVESISEWWDGLVTGLSDGWESLRAGVFDAWNSTVEGVKTGWSDFTTSLSNAWQAVSDAFTAIWNGIRDGVFLAWNLYVEGVKLSFEAVTGALKFAWELVRDTFVGVWNTIKSVVFDAFNTYVSNVRNNFDLVTSAMGAAWDWLKNNLHAGYAWIKESVFDAFGNSLDTLEGWFQTAVDGIRKIWEGLKEAAAAPVRFVVDTVWNNGLLKAVEAITKFIPGLNAPDPVEIGFRRGGILPGYSRMADGDDQLVPMRRGEGVLVSEGLRDERSRGLFLAANEEAKRGKSFAAFMSDYVAGYAGGGIIGSMQSVMREFYPELSLTSGLRPGDSGYHGTGQAADFSNTGSGMPSTPAMQAASAFMYTNYGDQLEQLIHHPARNIGEGRDVGDGFGFYGSGTMYGHTDHIHLAALRALVDPSGVVQMMPYDGSGGGGFSLMGAVKAAWDAVINKINPFSGEGNGSWFSQIPGAFLSTAGDKLWNFVSGKIGSGSYDGAGGAIGDAESWREMAMAAMRRNGFNADDPAQVNAMLRQIMSESGGNPSVVQQVQDVNSGGNEAVGLLQVIPGTFAANRDPSLPDDRTDPWANMNAALRYYKGRYGSDLTTMWGHGHGYAAGGIIDLPELFTRDLGGIVPSGALVRNTSGRDELMLPPETTALLNQFFREFPEVARALESSVVALEGAAEWLAEAADSTSVEGITARQSARRVLGLGLDLPGAGVMAEFLDAEESLLASRARHLGHLDNLAEKEQALEEARKALADMESSEGGLSKDEQRKLDDAIKARDEAQANLEQAESEEKRAEATEKLADSEEKLTRVREDLDANAEKSAEKHAEEIVKANDAVVKAEQDLVEAKKQQVQDLDHMVLVSQGSIMGMIPQVEGLASQIIGMGVPAAAVNQGLGQVIGSLTSVAGMAGPAGISLGMAFDAVKIGIELVQMFEGIIKDLVAEFTKWRVARHQVFAEYAGNIAQINALVREQKQRVVDLAAAWVDATAAMAAAVRAVTAAAGGVFKAALAGAQGVADVQQRIRDAMSSTSSSGGGGGSSSGSAPWDMGLLYDSYSNQLTAEPRVKKSSSGASTRDVVNGLSEIAALQYDLLAAEINSQILMKQAALDLLNAQHAQWQAQVALVRLEEDLGRQIRHLNSLQEIQVQFAMNEQQALLAQAYADMAVKVAEAEATNMDLGNRIGAFLDFDGDGKVFGLFTNVGSSSIQAAEAQKEAALEQMKAIEKMAESYGGLPDMGDLEASIDQAARLIAAGEDAAADMAIWGSELGNPDRMLQITELETTLRNVDENQLGLARTIEDLRASWEHLQEVMPLEEDIFSLENARDAHTAQAEALRASSVEVRAAAEALRDFHLQAVNAKPQETTLTVVIPSRGQMVDPDDLDAAFSQLGTQIQGLNFRVQRVEDSGKAGAGAALATRK